MATLCFPSLVLAQQQPTQDYDNSRVAGQEATSQSAIQSEDAAGEKRVWQHPLPFMAQDVIDLGFDLPKPFGLSLTYNTMQHDLALDNLKVDIRRGTDFPGQPQPVKAARFDDVRDDNQSTLLRFDAWLLPFLNLFAIAGSIEGRTDLGLTVDLNRQFPLSCSGTCPVINSNGSASYKGTTYGLGFNLAAGYKNMFGVLNATYNRSDVDIAPGAKITSLNISPRIGLNSTVGQWGNLATYVGLTYLSYQLDIEDQITIQSVALVPVIGSDRIIIDYSIEANEQRNWNALVGANWDVSPSWSVQAELHGGGLRQQFISSVTYRF